MGKVSISVLTEGPAVEFERQGLSAATAHFTQNDPDEEKDLPKPTIFSYAVLAILGAPASVVNGQLLLGEDFLREHAGVADFSKYSVVPGSDPRRIVPKDPRRVARFDR
ncbi:short chain dehydrogenase family protein [Diaporthe helianthi]|uniref:Short chain dehydrogenase family protein n=1 Tax=Diaporthe helianthi TaxID=158607 RepID=A0A2P5I601_DIAHE|nr:short chain dehydrogenase family protein [Diaporthe helianthi]